MTARRPRLPMFLGLAVLTAMANVLVLAAHALLHVGLGVRVGGDGALLAALVALGPLVGVALMTRGRPRHGAALLALFMLLGVGASLWTHYAADGDENVAYARTDLWGDLYVGSSFMQVAFGLQGFAAGMILLFKPEVPRPRQAEMPAP